VAGLWLLTACSTPTAGEPQPTSTAEPVSTAESTSEAPDAPEYSLARLCELISAEEAMRLGGAEEGEKGNSASDGHAICTWSDATALVVGFQDGVTTADVKDKTGATNTSTTIDGLTAIQSLKTEPAVICQVMVDLPSGKLFTAAVGILSAGEGRYDACQTATELSNLIIPRVKDQ
jgi:hypothetical protein